MPTPDEFYTAASRRLQDEHDSRKLADAVAHSIVGDELRPDQASFIAGLDFFFLATVNETGEPTVSYKGGAVGVVQVVGSRRLIFPHYDGNGMFLSTGNVAATSKVGLLFIDLGTPARVRVQGAAQLTRDAGDTARFPGANMVVEVAITAVFDNCARYIHRHARVEASKYVPDANGDRPFTCLEADRRPAGIVATRRHRPGRRRRWGYYRRRVSGEAQARHVLNSRALEDGSWRPRSAPRPQ